MKQSSIRTKADSVSLHSGHVHKHLTSFAHHHCSRSLMSCQWTKELVKETIASSLSTVPTACNCLKFVGVAETSNGAYSGKEQGWRQNPGDKT